MINGIVVTEYSDMILVKCCDYIPKELKEIEKPLGRTAKQLKPLMGFTQEY